MLKVQGAMLTPLNFKEEELGRWSRTTSFKMAAHEPVSIPRTPKKAVLEPAISFKNWEPETKKGAMQSSDAQLSPASRFCELISPKPRAELDAAAVKLQKVYKSYRTRRNLADCAIISEEFWWKTRSRQARNLWWKTLESVSLEQTSITFFNNGSTDPESAVQKWTRAKKRIARVGRGFMRNAQAQTLALRHWLEAIDPRHRYGHNLHIYYEAWSKLESTQPFFYWLDVGDGKELSLEKCPRKKLIEQTITYLGPEDKKAYEVIVENGKLVYRKSGEYVNTIEGTKWIFVLSASKTLYIGQKKKGTFQHSSFLAGAVITAAGRLVAKDGVLEAIWPYSGHYLPTEEHFEAFINFLLDNNVDLTNVKKCAVDDDQYPSLRKSEDEMNEVTEIINQVEDDVQEPEVDIVRETSVVGSSVPASTIEFARRQSFKWASPTVARISYVREYSADIQAKALEQVNLSPRVMPSPRNNVPIPSPRPSPKMMISPKLAYMGFPSQHVSPKVMASPRLAYFSFPSPRVSLKLPTSMRG